MNWFPEITAEQIAEARTRGPLPPPFVATSTARTPDGSVVAEGRPYSNGALARVWRLPTLLIPRSVAVSSTTASAVNLATWAAAAALAVWIVKRLRR